MFGVDQTHSSMITCESVEDGADSIMIWVCFADSGPGRLVIIDGAVNFELYKQSLQETEGIHM